MKRSANERVLCEVAFKRDIHIDKSKKEKTVEERSRIHIKISCTFTSFTQQNSNGKMAHATASPFTGRRRSFQHHSTLIRDVDLVNLSSCARYVSFHGNLFSPLVVLVWAQG
jgi:hypothetical protein